MNLIKISNSLLLPPLFSNPEKKGCPYFRALKLSCSGVQVFWYIYDISLLRDTMVFDVFTDSRSKREKGIRKSLNARMIPRIRCLFGGVRRAFLTFLCCGPIGQDQSGHASRINQTSTRKEHWTETKYKMELINYLPWSPKAYKKLKHQNMHTQQLEQQRRNLFDYQR